eukprot:4144170-Prymnesium_polylepis.1
MLPASLALPTRPPTIGSDRCNSPIACAEQDTMNTVWRTSGPLARSIAAPAQAALAAPSRASYSQHFPSSA